MKYVVVILGFAYNKTQRCFSKWRGHRHEC